MLSAGNKFNKILNEATVASFGRFYYLLRIEKMFFRVIFIQDEPPAPSKRFESGEVTKSPSER